MNILVNIVVLSFLTSYSTGNPLWEHLVGWLFFFLFIYGNHNHQRPAYLFHQM